MTEKWMGLGPAVNETVDRLIALGLPESAKDDAYELLWALASWHGDREYANGYRQSGD